MSSAQPTIVDPETRRGRQYGTSTDGTPWTRRVHPTTGAPLTPWTPVEPVLPPSSSPLVLSLITENQSDSEVRHWSLFCHRPPGSPRGRAWQVTGDAEFMVCNHEHDADKLGGDAFASCQVLNDDLSAAQLARVEHVVAAEPPPRAPNRSAVTENCQGWVVRVLKRLAAEGIVQQHRVAELEKRLDPVN
ncbi:hypothetical protein CCM_09131 [Cordyceps militaris CM01]|uniref:Uncharacterized protein n=1 Tax=Cordyceps militaris (strain CM01) TaxID=983644 RepID=G3JTJ1_CORMM|nr:uncharacterized protein CCM_09131 [Cordyceps militaris CM01]EGX87995.1 hypothetical protein CCM_09131 [Cordyceps militaris CM01]